MFFYEGYTCPVCGRAFAPNDDVVACPECGLPHHRECWIQEGHCHLAHLHDTPEQWSREKKTAPAESAKTPDRIRCPRCGTDNLPFSEFCSHCGTDLDNARSWGEPPTPNRAPYSEYKPFSPFEPVSDDPVEGHSLQEMEAIVSSRTHYYLPRFRRIRQGQGGGWNWSAFIFAPYWLLYRKMYLAGSLYLLIQLLYELVVTFVMNAMNLTTIEDLMAFTQMTSYNKGQEFYLLSIFLFSAILWIARFLLAGLGNRLYRYHCTKVIDRAKEKVPDITPAELATRGGVSVAMVIVGYLALYFSAQLIALLL